MRHTQELAITLGAVLLLFLCVMPVLLGCDDGPGLGAMLGAVALACFAVAGAVARPRGNAWLGALLGAGLYLLPGVLLVSLFLSVFGGWSQGVLWNLGLLLWWPLLPVGVMGCGP